MLCGIMYICVHTPMHVCTCPYGVFCSRWGQHPLVERLQNSSFAASWPQSMQGLSFGSSRRQPSTPRQNTIIQHIAQLRLNPAKRTKINCKAIRSPELMQSKIKIEQGKTADSPASHPHGTYHAHVPKKDQQTTKRSK
jgi:hypothetical protein